MKAWTRTAPTIPMRKHWLVYSVVVFPQAGCPSGGPGLARGGDQGPVPGLFSGLRPNLHLTVSRGEKLLCSFSPSGECRVPEAVNGLSRHILRVPVTKGAPATCAIFHGPIDCRRGSRQKAGVTRNIPGTAGDRILLPRSDSGIFPKPAILSGRGCWRPGEGARVPVPAPWHCLPLSGRHRRR